MKQLLLKIFPLAISEFRKIKKSSSLQYPEVSRGNVIILPYRINPNAQWFEFLIAIALRLRGYNPIMGFGEDATPFCDGYFCTKNRWLSRLLSLWRARQFARVFNVELCSFSVLLGRQTLHRLEEEAFCASADEIPVYSKYGVDLGKQVMGSLSRYFLRCEVNIANNIKISRQFLFTALVSVEAARIMSERYRPKLLISSHGIYASWGSFCEYFFIKKIPYVTWGFQYKKSCFIFSHNKSYHRDIIEEKPESWRDYCLSEGQRKDLLNYIMNKGGSGSHSDNINYYSGSPDNSASIRDVLEIQDRKPIFGLFPNLSWDAQVSFRPLFFKNMNEWVIETISWFIDHPEKILIVRSHPAEIRGPAETQEKIVDIVSKYFPSLPGNIHVIPPDSGITSYNVLTEAQVCLVYGSKFGLEAAIMRKPLIICGEAYFRNKGMSYDPSSKNEYFSLLNQAPGETPVTNKMYERALNYGYHYNFRRQFYLPLSDMDGPKFKQYRFTSTKELCPGNMPYLDNFIEKCFSGKPFIQENYLEGVE